MLGGISTFLKKGDRVLIKPNLLAAKAPDKAVTTHPSVVRSVVEMVKGAGGIPIIGDNPAIGSWKNIVEKTGMQEVAQSTGAELSFFTDSIRIERDSRDIFKRLEMASIIREVDVIINLPKLKTHSQMFLTLGVKNLYGFIIGKKKARLHLEAGNDPFYFATMLVEIYKSIKPSLTLVDGIMGMEGNGPGSGDIRHIGLIMGAVDCIALDRVICEILGAEKKRLFTTVIGEKINAGETDLDRIEILGERIDDVRAHGFKFPKMMDVEFGPKSLRKYVKKMITSKPVEDREKCTLCSYCVKSCPPEIISEKHGRLYFDYDMCIRCYCCVEVCPHGAMIIKQGWLARALGLG